MGFGNNRGSGFRGRSNGFGGGFRPRRNFGPREMTKIKCSECGKEAEVPFKPRNDTPVYCKECYFKKKGITPRESNSEGSNNEDNSEQNSEESEEEY